MSVAFDGQKLFVDQFATDTLLLFISNSFPLIKFPLKCFFILNYIFYTQYFVLSYSKDIV